MTARLGGAVQFGRRPVGPLARPGIDRRVNSLAVNAEFRRQRLEECDTWSGCQFVVAREQLARQRDA